MYTLPVIYSFSKFAFVRLDSTILPPYATPSHRFMCTRDSLIYNSLTAKALSLFGHTLTLLSLYQVVKSYMLYHPFATQIADVYANF